MRCMWLILGWLVLSLFIGCGGKVEDVEAVVETPEVVVETPEVVVETPEPVVIGIPGVREIPDLPELDEEDLIYLDYLVDGLYMLTGELNLYLISVRSSDSIGIDGILHSIDMITVLPVSPGFNTISSQINLTMLKLGGALQEFDRCLVLGLDREEPSRILGGLLEEIDFLYQIFVQERDSEELEEFVGGFGGGLGGLGGGSFD